MQYFASFIFIVFIFIPRNHLKWVWERSQKHQINYVWPYLVENLMKCNLDY